MSGAADVVDELLTLEAGDVVELEAEQYSWGNAYEVGDVEDVEFIAPSGDRWRARRLTFDPEDARASSRDIRAIEGCAPPDLGPGYGRLADVEPVQGTGDEVPLIDAEWLARPADEIVEVADVSRDLEEVLRIAERADTWLKVHQRLGASRTTVTKNLLWELGLRQESGVLIEEDERHHRINRLREVFLDDE